MLLTDSSLYICKILITSQDTLEISQSLRKKNKVTVLISLSSGNKGTAINRTIEHYVNSKLSNLPDHFKELDPNSSVLAQVKRILLEKSNGIVALDC